MRVISTAACTALVAGLLATAVPGAQASGTSSESCAPLLKKAKKAKRAGQKAKAKRLRTKLRSCKNAGTVRSALAGYTFTGTRGDGDPVTLTLCADGRWESRVGSSPVAVSDGTAWHVRNTAFTNATKWVTQVGENKDRRQGGWGVGLARDGGAFQLGVASFDGVTDLGPVIRSSAGTACA